MSAATEPLITAHDTLSIIIVSWNTRELLRGCLYSLFAGGGLYGMNPQAIEVWVVDNGSHDGSLEMVAAQYPQVRCIANEHNLGFARACNQALCQARGRYFLLLNPDTIVAPTAISSLLLWLTFYPKAAAASPLLRNRDNSPQLCWARFPDIASEWTGILDRSQSPYPLTEYAAVSGAGCLSPFAVDWVGGACFLVRAEAVAAVGLLDERFFLYGEETDWCRRFHQAGWDVIVVPEVSVRHLGGGSSRQISAAWTRTLRYRARLQLYQRLYGWSGALLPAAIATGRYLLGLFRDRPASTQRRRV